MRYGREHAYKNSNKLLLRLGLENKKDLEHYLKSMCMIDCVKII